MNTTQAYHNFDRQRRRFVFGGFSVLVMTFHLLANIGIAKEAAEGEEISIELGHKIIGGAVCPAFLSGNTVFVHPADVFNFIKVRNDATADGDRITGYYIDPDAK
ncbi:MAG: hypothetical protein ABI778_07510, partial [Ignavibacteriota bacterium]